MENARPTTPSVSPLPLQDILPRLLAGWSADTEAAHALVMQAPEGAMDPDFVLTTLCHYLHSERAPGRYVSADDRIVARLDDIACWALGHGANPALRIPTGNEDATKDASVLGWLLSSPASLPRVTVRLLENPSAATWLAETVHGKPLDTHLLERGKVQVLEAAAAAGLQSSRAPDGTLAWELWVPGRAAEGISPEAALRAESETLKRLGWLPPDEASYKQALGRMMKKSRPAEARRSDKMTAVGAVLGFAARASNVSILSSLLTASLGGTGHPLADHRQYEELRTALKSMTQTEALAPVSIKRAGSNETWSTGAALVWAILVTHSQASAGGLQIPGMDVAGADIAAMLRGLPTSHPARAATIGTRKGHAFTLNGLLLLESMRDAPIETTANARLSQQQADEVLGAFLAIAPSVYEDPTSASMRWRSDLARPVMAMLATFTDSATRAPDARVDPDWLARAWLDVAGTRCDATLSAAWHLVDQIAAAVPHCQVSPLSPTNQAWLSLAAACACQCATQGSPPRPTWLPPPPTHRRDGVRDTFLARVREDAHAALAALHIEDTPAMASLLPPASNPPPAAVWLDAAHSPQSARINSLRAATLMLAWSCAGMGKAWLSTKFSDRRRQASTKERESLGAAASMIMPQGLRPGNDEDGFGTTQDPQVALAFVETASRVLFATTHATLMASNSSTSLGVYLGALFHCAQVCADKGLQLSAFARTAMADVLGPHLRSSWSTTPAMESADHLIGLGWSAAANNNKGFHPAAALAWLGQPVENPDSRFSGILANLTAGRRDAAARELLAGMSAAETRRRLAAAKPPARPRPRA